ncbi:hypothetical protein EVAR_31686_1 [Eumeta japonica]|uniref:Uncharacterized protein n=1 Tax=Eumeta variegata TaxID=151549 RepID=A0A4C1VT92_EUMVA|nr:hypothetical protein EVAR_31686_1 [Eumeta japonica]
MLATKLRWRHHYAEMAAVSDEGIIAFGLLHADINCSEDSITEIPRGTNLGPFTLARSGFGAVYDLRLRYVHSVGNRQFNLFFGIRG